jgi:large subunit ribosomal protein L23
MEKNNFNLINLLNLVKYPSLTEKSISLYANRQYTFIVNKSLTKPQIKFVIEQMFDVSIININTCNLPLKKRRVGKFIGKRATYKKAYIQLKKGDTISNLFN